MPKPKKKKTKVNYWGVYAGKNSILFTGTFKESWDHLVKVFGRRTLASLAKEGIRVRRTN